MTIFLAHKLSNNCDYEQKVGEYIANNISEYAGVLNPQGYSKSSAIKMLVNSDYVLELDDSEDTKFLVSVARFLNIDIGKVDLWKIRKFSNR